MKINKGWKLTVVLMLALTGCQKNEDNENSVIVEPIKKGNYGFALPYVSSSTSVIHNKYQSNRMDSYFMGEQALELSKPYFDPSSCFASEGQVLSSEEYERFDASYRGLGLLKYKTDYNPEGLNPEKGTYVPSGTGINMYNAILVSDILEIDFVDKDGKAVGYQFTIVLNENITYYDAQLDANGNPLTDKDGNVLVQSEAKKAKITTQQLYTYGSLEAGQRLVSYLRNNHPEVGDLPIQILLYKTSSADSNISGVFIGESYINTRSSTSYTPISQEWVFAPSSRLNTLNSVLAGQISSVKNQLFEHFPNEVGYYGRVFFKDNMASEVELEINMRGKTYVEIQSLIQYVASLSSQISENDVELNIHVLSDGDTVAMLHRDAGSNELTINLR